MLAADTSAAQQSSSAPDVGHSRAVLSFSLCNADPSRDVYSWDFAALGALYLRPALQALEPLVQTAVHSQVLYYTPAQVQGTWSEAHGAYLVRFEALPFFLDRSWAPDAGELSPTDSYVVPRWGGVIIFNPPASREPSASGAPPLTVLPPQQLEGVFSIVRAQLRQHLGLPGSCAASAINDGAPTFSDDDVAALMRRALEWNLRAAGSSLASLARLVRGLPSLEMPDLVGDQVREALAAHARAMALKGASDMSGAVAASQKARETADAAFFHPSILAQLSFPAQHKLAIYLPFFLPATLPLAIGFVKEARRAVFGPPHP